MSQWYSRINFPLRIPHPKSTMLFMLWRSLLRIAAGGVIVAADCDGAADKRRPDVTAPAAAYSRRRYKRKLARGRLG